jgi:glycopeptide antibiotics resistance protein
MDFNNHLNFVIDLSTMLLVALVWCGTLTFLRLKKKKSFVYLLFFTIFYIYIVTVLYYTEFQYQYLLLLKQFTPDLMLHGIAAGKSLNLIPLITLTLKDLRTSFLNILLMLPFGFGLPFITNLRMKKVVIIGALFSIGIEFLQLVTGVLAKMTFRIADINDVIFNTIGVVIGYMLFVGFMRIYRRIFRNGNTSSNPIVRYITERPQANNRREVKLMYIIILVIAAAILLGYMAYNNPPQEILGAGAGVGQSNLLGNEQEGTIPQSGDLCGGTGGIGQIVSLGNNTFTINRKDGRDQIVDVAGGATIETPTGSGSLSDLKTGDSVTLVGGTNPDGSFTARTVLVCSGTGPG